jgi:hypothetical protein
VPDASCIGIADIAAILDDIGHDIDFRTGRQRILTVGRHFDFAEMPAESHVLLGCELLVAKPDHRTLVENLFDFPERRAIDVLR